MVQETNWLMRVVHIIKATRISGAERHLLILLSHLRQQDIDAQLVLLVEPDKPMDDMVQEAETKDIPIHRLVIHRDYDLRIIYHLRQLLRTIQPDIVHTHLIHADTFGIFAARIGGFQNIVISRHNDDAFRHRTPVRLLNQLTWGWVKAVVAISSSIKQFVIDVEHAPSKKVHVIRYGIDHTSIPALEIQQAQAKLREEVALPPQSCILGMACRLIEQKGLEYTIQAMPTVVKASPDTHLVIAGDGPLKEALQFQATELGIGDHVHFLGWRADIADLMGGFDIFLVPSLWEGFGLVLLEAMATRLPIVASRVSAIPEIVVHGETGFLVEPKDAAGLAKAICALLEDYELRRYLGMMGEARLETAFNANRMTSETIALYKNLLEPQ